MIQGPPGTGKTHTLVATVKNLLYNTSKNGTPSRILICTPSNGAIDAIALRLLETNFKVVRIERKKQEKEELEDAHVILSTLNSVQNDCMEDFKKGTPFRCIIIDEAGQSTEPELLMPLVYPTSKLILIGDHLQLPATIKSDFALDKGYGRSMFERFFCHLENTESQNGYSASPVITLQRQYRMVEEICRFPSWKFYNDQLETDKSGWNEDIPIYPYLVFDVCNSKEANTGQERDIVILSCVRAFDGSRGSVGFVESQQRMNVALTRAKSVLYVVLKADSFNQAPNWSELIADATQRGLLKQSEQPSEQKPVTNFDEDYYDEDYHYTPPPVDINTVYENDRETFLNVLLSLDLAVLRVDISKADKEKTAELVTNHLKAKNMFIHNSSPPGTGKTHTLVAIVKSLLYNQTSTSTPNRILICTPSNGAIDAIALRLLETNLKLVRIGNFDKVHPEVAHFHLQSKVSREQSYAQRKEQEKKVLKDAHVILSTLNSVQNDCMEDFKKGTPFRCIIIDEAGQSTEPELLMPLVYPTSKLILIGDHLQLPATVKSNSALSKGYGRSMFERFYCHLENTESQNAYSASPVITLQRQYRMVEDICKFPSWKFYNDQLETDKIGWNEDIPIYPYLVFDVCNSKEAKTASFSKYNVQEATFVCCLIKAIFSSLGYNLTKNVPETLDDFTIGIITFYGGQKDELIKQLTKLFNGELPNYIDVNTVDAFQGQERDIVILSCVRAWDGSRGSVGFVESQQRMNVALTRAKSVLFVVLKANSFTQAPNWSELIADATQRDILKQVNSRIRKTKLKSIISYN
ncbi:hypothetical protein TYRP_011237 [Tyrophagus putrescentiae]|nr:hypothetical protein TYRP_011237 [Tyrophagus putrescentiae]